MRLYDKIIFNVWDWVRGMQETRPEESQSAHSLSKSAGANRDKTENHLLSDRFGFLRRVYPGRFAGFYSICCESQQSNNNLCNSYPYPINKRN